MLFRSLSNLSGNIINRKSFSDDWQWSTRDGSNGTGSFAGFFYSICEAGAGFNFFSWQYNTYAGTCAKYSSGAQYSTVSGATASILPQCQAMHMSCDQLPLPVELMQFEVD